MSLCESFSTTGAIAASMAGGAFSRFVVENDQGIDGDAGFGVDQERVDVDRGDTAACVRPPMPRV